MRAAFRRRSFEALNRIATQAPTDSLAHALVASTDVGSLARILSDGDAIGTAVPALDPLAPLTARNAEHRLELLERCGDALTAEQAGKLIGISRQAIDERRRSGGPDRAKASRKLAVSALSIRRGTARSHRRTAQAAGGDACFKSLDLAGLLVGAGSNASG